MNDKKELKLGARVRWTSSASGTTATKTGVVVGIVPTYSCRKTIIRVDKGECELRDPEYFQREWKAWLREQRAAYIGGDARPWLRKDISYLVRVPGKTKKHKAKIYQPRVSALVVIE